jgi:hypothetical protein
VPIAIYNNVKGKDAEVLKKFKEPAWNNPVVRFVDAEGNDLIPRKDGVYSKAELIKRMVEALKATGNAVPANLKIIPSEPNKKDGVK